MRFASKLARKVKIPGFGHRVYRTEDPRATHLRRMSEELGKRAGNTRWFEMSRRIEQLVTGEKKLYPNVDFYSASTYYTLGIAIDLFTPIFAVSRISGWTAHCLEQYANNRLIRPRTDYIGPPYPQRVCRSTSGRSGGSGAARGSLLKLLAVWPAPDSRVANRRTASLRAAAIIRVPPHNERREHPQLLRHRPHRPWQVDAGRPFPRDDRSATGARNGSAGPRQHGPRARARHHDQGPRRPPDLQG